MDKNDIKIDVYLSGADRALKAMRELQQNANKFSRGKLKKQIIIETTKAKKALKELDGEIKRLEKERLNTRKHLNDLPAGYGDGLRKRIKDLTLRIQELQLKTREVKSEMQGMKSIDITPRLDWGFFTKVSSVIRNIGSSLLSLSGAIGRITAPLEMLTRGTLYSAAFAGINKITEGLSGSFERYDIMKTYPKIMQSMGASLTDAKAARDELYQAVLGLPTGLDTIIEAQKQYYLASGDMKKATKIAIAANNAFVAGGADDVQMLQGQRQLRDLMSAGELRISEWESLAKAMPSAFKAIQDDLHVTRSDIMAGKVSADKFINSLMKVATGEGVVAEAAENMKHTFNAVGSNIRNALRDAGVKTIEALDEVLTQYDGGDVIDHLLKIKPAIQEMRDSVVDWVKANPQAIVGFFRQLKEIDVMGILKGMAQPLMTLVKVFSKAMGFFGGGGEKFGRFIIQLHLFGKILGILGGTIKGSAPVMAFGAMIGRFLKTTEGWGKFTKIAVVDKLIKFFNRFKKVEKGAKAVEAAEGAAAGAAGATASLSSLLTGLLKVVTPAITIGAYAGAFALVGKTISSFGKSLSEIGELHINWEGVIKNVGGMSVAMTLMGALAKILGDATVASGGALGIALGIGGLEIVAMAELGKELASSINSITDAVNAISDVRIPDDTKIDEIGEAIEKILAVFDKIDTGNWKKSFGRRFRSGQDKKYLENVQSMIESLGTTLNAIKGIGDTIKSISDLKAVYYHVKRAKIITRQIRQFGIDFYDIMKDLTEADFGRETSGAGVARYEADTDMKGATKNFNQMASFFQEMDNVMSGMEAIPKHFIRIKKKMAKLKKAFKDENGELDTEAITTNIKNITSIIESVVNEGELGKLKAASDQLANTNLDNITSNLDKIPSLLNKLRELREYFNKNGTKWITPTGTKNIPQGTKMNGAIGGVMGAEPVYGGAADNMIQSIGRIATMVQTIAQKLSTIPDISSKADTLKSGITSIYNAYIRLNKFKNYTEKYPVDTKSLKTTISNMIKDLSGALTDAPTIMINAAFFKAAAKNLQGAFKILTTSKEGSISTFVSYLKKIPKALQQVNAAMKGRGAAWKRALVSGFSGTAKEIVNKINAIATAVNQNGASMAFFQAGATAGQSYVNGFNSAVGNAGGLASQVLGSIGSAINGIGGAFARTGGLIRNGKVLYRAAGGTVFQPRGTDTVPAMLSEGEYVMREKAVSTFGTKFMQRLNHLDLGGAVRSLGMRGGQLAYATPNLVVDNSKHITYNNNQSLNLTNNHASQGYSEARASRYLRNM